MNTLATTRRKLLQLIGLSAGAAVLSTTAIASVIKPDDIKRLNAEQQDFINLYGKWMDQFIVVIRTQRREPDNAENQKKMIDLTELAEAMRPELDKHMSDPVFAVIYRMAIERMTNEISV